MNRMAFDYDTSYVPSAPVVEIEIDGYDKEIGKQRLRVMIDSGADVTLIPLFILETVGATYKETRWMRGVTGERIEVDLYLTCLEIGTQLINGVAVVGTPATMDAVIGRDVLNQLVITLDGPGETAAVHTP